VVLPPTSGGDRPPLISWSSAMASGPPSCNSTPHC
jgi:hypothetical protein